MDYADAQCYLCHAAGHLKRFCPNQVCENCRDPGHDQRDCVFKGQLERFRIYFPMNCEVRVCLSETPARQIHEIMDNLQELRDMKAKTINASVFSAVFNALSIEYGQTGSISIVIRNRKATTETLIQIKPYHTNGILTPKVNVGAKYGVMNRTLSERIPRLATGAVVKNIPKANAYVVLFVPEMLDQTAIMQFNDDKYYLEWSHRSAQNEGSAEVCVSSQHSYQNRLALEGRDLIRNPRFLYTGELRVERPTAQSQVLKSEPDDTISPSDERNTETPVPSTSSTCSVNFLKFPNMR